MATSTPPLSSPGSLTAAPRPLEGRVALVTGGSGGIGSVVSERLAAAGAKVAVGYLRNREGAEEVAARIREAGGEALTCEGNVGSPDRVAELIDRVTGGLGALHHVVHCASLGSFRPLVEVRPSHWDLTFDTHARAFWLLAREAAPVMGEGGTLVALSSLGGRTFTPAYGAVGVAKAALEASVRYLAVELDGRGIRVNGVAGGPVDGERLRSSPAFEAIRQAALHRPGRRLGAPEELADVVVFLSSPLSRWVQGQVLVVDGGFGLC